MLQHYSGDGGDGGCWRNSGLDGRGVGSENPTSEKEALIDMVKLDLDLGDRESDPQLETTEEHGSMQAFCPTSP